MENAEVSFPRPASHDSTLQFHLPYNVTGQGHWLRPLPRPGPLWPFHSLQAARHVSPAELEDSLAGAWPGSARWDFPCSSTARKCSRGIRTTCSITQDALGKGKTAPAPPWLQRRSTHHLYPRRKARAKTASPPPTCKARINSHPALAKAHQRCQSYWKVSLIKGLVPICQSTPQGADNQLFLFYDYLWALVLISLAWITGRRMQKSIKAQCSVMT